MAHKENEDRRKGHCPNCGPDRWADVVGCAEHRDHDEHHIVWLQTEIRILKCRGCESLYVVKETYFSEDWDAQPNPETGEQEFYIPPTVTYWPGPSVRAVPDWALKLEVIDATLGSLFNDIYVALDNGLNVLAAIGIRTVFDRASELLKVDPELSFVEKLKALADAGNIGAMEQESLGALTDAGSAAAHRGWKPTAEEIDAMASILEAFIYSSFIVPAHTAALKSKVPQREKKPD